VKTIRREVSDFAACDRYGLLPVLESGLILQTGRCGPHFEDAGRTELVHLIAGKLLGRFARKIARTRLQRLGVRKNGK